ncbi:thiol-activated cytolysin C-terminal domain-containing protein, partial [Bacillus mycoides]
EWWRTIINEQNVPLTNEIKVSIGGTTLHPTANISH